MFTTVVSSRTSREHCFDAGVAAYFVSEQMGQDSFVGSGGELMIMQALNSFPGELSLAQLSCIIVNSIAMTSGDMYESIKTRELVAAFKTVRAV